MMKTICCCGQCESYKPYDWMDGVGLCQVKGRGVWRDASCDGVPETSPDDLISRSELIVYLERSKERLGDIHMGVVAKRMIDAVICIVTVFPKGERTDND